MMNDDLPIARRQMLRLLAAAGLLAGTTAIHSKKAMAACEGDGTPQQFIPKTAPDPKPLENELQKYPQCPYCGMARKQWHHNRHLVHYSDDLVDGTCSLHCAALSLALNMDRGPQAIYAADYGSTADPKALLNVQEATYLIGSDLPGTMTRQSKVAFASPQAAQEAQSKHGGQLGDFDAALRAAYMSMADDTIMIRKRRAEKRRNQ
jgi:nitrous oxide reductase accessory protein NosL